MENQYPSVAKMVCPQCGKADFRILGTKGSLGKAVGGGLMFGAIGNMAASAISKDQFDLVPVNYQCLNCKNKFEALPMVATPDELLSVPCTITVHRLGSVVGMAV